MSSDDTHDLLYRFGQRIKDLRLQRDLSQEDLSHLVGLHRTYVGAVERGERNISLKNIEKLAQALQVEIIELFREQLS